MRGSLLASSVVLMLTGCGQNLAHIRTLAPEENNPAVACGVAPDGIVVREQALCIAKVAGLSKGMSRWHVREYETYIDVFNTTQRYPSAAGENVRIAQRGGAVLEKSRWQEITVQ